MLYNNSTGSYLLLAKDNCGLLTSSVLWRCDYLRCIWKRNHGEKGYRYGNTLQKAHVAQKRTCQWANCAHWIHCRIIASVILSSTESNSERDAQGQRCGWSATNLLLKYHSPQELYITHQGLRAMGGYQRADCAWQSDCPVHVAKFNLMWMQLMEFLVLSILTWEIFHILVPIPITQRILLLFAWNNEIIRISDADGETYLSWPNNKTACHKQPWRGPF